MYVNFFCLETDGFNIDQPDTYDNNNTFIQKLIYKESFVIFSIVEFSERKIRIQLKQQGSGLCIRVEVQLFKDAIEN